MKALIFGIVGAIAGAVAGEMFGADDLFLVGGALGVLVGLWLNANARLTVLEQRHRELLIEFRNALFQLDARADGFDRRLKSLETRSSTAAQVIEAPIAAPQPAPTRVVFPAPVAQDQQPSPVPSSAATTAAAPTRAAVIENVAYAAHAPATPPAATFSAPARTTPAGPDSDLPAQPDPVDQFGRWLRALLFGGNTVVRVGIFVLLVGVSLLLRWAAEHSLFPIELRMSAAGLIGLALVAVGYRQRTLRPGFARTLQGGGVAATYLVVFFSFHNYHLLPASLAFALLACVALSSGVLAVVQDAMALVVIGQIGGFLAPLLASTGEGNHVALFAYYLLLNLLILGVAWFKPWRALNLIGFAFTFGIGTTWGVLSYQPEHFPTTEPFLIAFFLLYTAIPVMYALRRPDERSGFVDGTLIFGTPLATLLLQYAMVKDIHFAMAFSALGLAAVYVGLSRFLYARAPEALRSLIESFLAIGIGFATLAVPYGLDNHNLTGATWALEGAGLYWVGVRQERWLSRLAGAVLQVLAAGALLMHSMNWWDAAGLPLANTQFIAGVLVCGAALFVARHAYAHRAELAEPEWQGLQALIASGLAFWFAVWLREIHLHIADDVQPGTTLLLLGATAVALELVASKLDWAPGRYPALLIVPVTAVALAVWQLDFDLHPLARGGAFGFAGAFAACVIVLRRLVSDASSPVRMLHALLLWTVTGFALLEATHLTSDMAGLNRDWRAAAAGLTIALVLIAVVSGARAATWWPFREHHETYLYRGAGVLVLGLLLWSLLAATGFAGDAAPLPYIPVLNPLDLAQLAAVIAIVSWRAGMNARAYPNANHELVAALPRVLLASMFVWFNAVLARSVHHYAHVPFNAHDLWRSVPLQVAVSVSWSVLGLIATVAASKRRSRVVWVFGATLLGVIVLKLFTIDLARLSTIAKIGTFLVVGFLLVLVGYFAPVPPPPQQRSDEGGQEPPLERQPEAGP